MKLPYRHFDTSHTVRPELVEGLLCSLGAALEKEVRSFDKLRTNGFVVERKSVQRPLNHIGIECLSMLGLGPVEQIRVASELGCGHVSLNLSGSANRLPCYPEFSIRDDAALRREIVGELAANGVRLSLLEGFAIVPDSDPNAFAPQLDMAAELGARAICAVSLDRDLERTYAAFARIAEMSGERGLIATTEVGAGVMRNLARSVAAIEAVANPAFQLLVDTMHIFRSGSTVADFAALSPGAVGHIQLCDVPMPAEIENYMEEALYERRAPGDGDLPLAEFLALVPPEVPIGLEIPIRSEAEAGVSPRERLGRCVAAARRLLPSTAR